MKSQISSSEFTRLLVAERLNPLGPSRADLRIAKLTAVLMNCHRGKGSRPAKTMDFMPDFSGDRRRLDVRTMRDRHMGMAAASAAKRAKKQGM